MSNENLFIFLIVSFLCLIVLIVYLLNKYSEKIHSFILKLINKIKYIINSKVIYQYVVYYYVQYEPISESKGYRFIDRIVKITEPSHVTSVVRFLEDTIRKTEYYLELKEKHKDIKIELMITGYNYLGTKIISKEEYLESFPNLKDE